MRAIPGTMATQHPDNAFAPYWDEEGRPFVSAYQEIAEALACFKDLGVSEYMWDWEGKHADAAVIDRLFSDYYDYFSKNQLGRDKFLTFRIPNVWEEKGYNLLQAMTAILSSEDFARDLKFQQRPLFEVILPMTERSAQLMRMHQLFERLARFKSTDFTKHEPDNNDYLELIPLVEGVESQLGIGELLTEYAKSHSQHFGRKPEYIRPFLACSDSSLSSGLLAGIIGNKVALSKIYEFSEQSGIQVFPIAGPGGLHFRGGLTPAPTAIDRFIAEFPGVRTVSVQSSFRYDYPKATVKTAIAKLEKDLPKAKPRVIPAKRQKDLIAIAKISTKFYKDTLAGILTDMQPLFKVIPKRRDRRQHIGLVAYSRSMGEQTIPRAITFTSAFYSIGVPPEILGLGRALRQLTESQLALLKEEYPSLTTDIQEAGRFFNVEVLSDLARKNSAWKGVQEDVAGIETVLGIRLEPQTKAEDGHSKLSSKLAAETNKARQTELIAEMAGLRKSLG